MGKLLFSVFLMASSVAQATIVVGLGGKRAWGGGWNCKVTCSDGTVHLVPVSNSNQCHGKENVLNLSSVCLNKVAAPQGSTSAK